MSAEVVERLRGWRQRTKALMAAVIDGDHSQNQVDTAQQGMAVSSSASHSHPPPSTLQAVHRVVIDSDLEEGPDDNLAAPPLAKRQKLNGGSGDIVAKKRNEEGKDGDRGGMGEETPESSNQQQQQNDDQQLVYTCELPPPSPKRSQTTREAIEEMLNKPTWKERQRMLLNAEAEELINRPTVKDRALLEQFKSVGKSIQEFCANGSRTDCENTSEDGRCCALLHFRKVIRRHTLPSMGNCPYLGTCFNTYGCKYVHYELEYGKNDSRRSGQRRDDDQEEEGVEASPMSVVVPTPRRPMLPAQWIQCDVRYFDYRVLGTFAVVMADPPWDIRMELPYGTMSDEEMRRLNIGVLQEEGLIFLWVTMRALELGRECLELWGYRLIDEIIWVKTNQLQRFIRTGKTGYWINHAKEHCLVGIKGPTSKYNAGLDTDVIVSEVRETSHKPDEIYGIIERLSPGTRKLELFGRQHNTQPNWVTLGNQLDGVRLVESAVVRRFKRRYPTGDCMPTTDEVDAAKQRDREERFREREERFQERIVTRAALR